MSRPSSLEGWLALLEARHGARIRLGLDRVQAVLARLAARSEAVVISVGGTNGKGSVCAMLESILGAAGFRVGVYTSPHLVRYTERVRIDGREIDEARMVSAFDTVEQARQNVDLTYFEHGTLAAWDIFCRQPLDVIILEVGLGGRLDAVNAIEPDCSIVTSIALDHMDFLGSTREQIGFEKAGIFRSGKPAICGDPQPPASLLAHAAGIGAQLWVSGRDFGFGGDRQQWGFWRYQDVPARGKLLRRGGLAYPALRGANQLLNASAVLAALELLRERIPVSMQAVRQGLMMVELPGRFQVLPGKPAVVLDVAHNPQAAGVLAENLSNMGFYPETWAVFGAFGDKDVEGIASLLRNRIDHWLLASLPGPRGLSAEALRARLERAGITEAVECFDSPVEAFAAARVNAGESDRIVAFGSFVTVGDVLAGARP
ncbi:MAG TPA: bifunctional tetrahydrofolate synthase/dihydrofolate synthase [Rhodocyclaceae bacterium]|nr:bifunctional tetrahydrofolate synthase/dihydrofolate synthase [Rhodocyclaceae bacterium]HRQ45829.1 bifunctional tetrahydrofolate synthase/dihydrofolate synthase [Rhodocyclaceae bacterium]